MEFARFMASSLGRGIRILAGVILFGLGYYVVDSEPWNWIVMIVALVPILGGLFNFCTVAPLLGAPFKGEDALRR